MEKLVRKVCIDSNVLIDLLNESERTQNLSSSLENCKIFTTSINAFELMLRQRNIKEMENFLQNMDVISFEEEDAIEASRIAKALSRKGKIVDYRDIFIAAIVKSTRSELLTFNKKHFENIPGLKLVKFN